MEIREFKDIIAFWPSQADFGRDIEIKPVTARAMFQRNSIASEYWMAIIEAAKKRKYKGITVEKLAQIAAK